MRFLWSKHVNGTGMFTLLNVKENFFKKMGCLCCVIQLTYIKLCEAVPYEGAKSRIVFSFNSSFPRLMTQGKKNSHSYYLICSLSGDDRGWNWELPDGCTCLTFMLSLPPQSKLFLGGGCVSVQKQQVLFKCISNKCCSIRSKRKSSKGRKTSSKCYCCRHWDGYHPIFQPSFQKLLASCLGKPAE